MTSTERLKIIILNTLPLFLALGLFLRPDSRVVSQLWQQIRSNEIGQSPEQLTENYQALLAFQPWHSDIWGKLAELQSQQGDFAGAIQSLNRLTELDSLTNQQSLLLAQAYLQNGEKQNAAQLWQSLSLRSDLTADMYREILESQSMIRDWQGAYRTAQALALHEPQDAGAHYTLALYQTIFDPQAAGKTLLQAVQGMPSRSDAVRHLQTVVNEIIAEENPAFRYVLAGRGLSNLGEWRLSSAAYEQVTILDPGYAEGWAFYGNALSYCGENGLPALLKAEEINPQSKIVRAMLAVYWRMQADYPASLRILEKLSTDEPQEPFWHYEIGNTLASSGQLSQALQSYQKATELAPKDSFYWMGLAKFTLNYAFLVETEGLEAARQANLLAPQDADVIDTLGMVYLFMENYPTAERFLIRANQISPYSSIILLHLGQLYYFKQENNLAYFYLTNAIKYAQNDTIMKLANDLLRRLP